MRKTWTLLHGNIVEKPVYREGPTLNRAVFDIEEAYGVDEENFEEINIDIVSSNHMGSIFWNDQQAMNLGELSVDERDRLRELIIEKRRANECSFSLIATGKENPESTWFLLNLARPSNPDSQVGVEENWYTWMFDKDRINTRFTYGQLRLLRDALDQMNLLYFRI